MPRFPKNIEYAERGQGQALLFVPGSFGTGAGWKLVINSLGEGYRCISTSLLGYGGTLERRSPGNTTMTPQTDALDSVLEQIGEPTHVVAHSFGGLSAVAHAISGRRKAVGLILVEPNPFGILRTAGDYGHYDMFSTMMHAYFDEFHAGKQDAARRVIDFYGGAGSFDAFPEKVRDNIVATTPTNIRDWASAAAFEPPLADYGKITVPTLIVRGQNSHPAMARIADLLIAHLQNARLATIQGGSHFLPSTHPAELASLIALQVKRTGEKLEPIGS